MTKFKIKKPEPKPQEQKEEQIAFPVSIQERKKSIFKRMIDIVLEDIKSVFHVDRKTREDRMKYEAFMEMCKK